MKNQFRLATAATSIGSAAVVTLITGNPLMGMASAGLVGFAGQQLGGFSFNDESGVASCNALIGLKRQCQTLTIGGAKRLYIVLAEDLASEFLTYDLAKTAGEYTGAIPLVATKKFIEVEAWYDTTKFDTEMKLGAGFTQSIEFKILGYGKDIVRFASLLCDTPVNLIVQGNDDKLYYIGQKYIPMMLEMKGTMPEKGTGRKEATFTAKQDGMQVPVFPLASATTFAVEPLVAPVV
ncbi:hypothetical protein [Dyadobacter diqingensis]|uniref:hypothetical protein n=1 Tax=Dyadobacter diqingensis TaxID=2938121 RepID=UPI0020C345B1|nr:hypothetical protein [Dyadobacter diqingensis]